MTKRFIQIISVFLSLFLLASCSNFLFTSESSSASSVSKYRTRLASRLGDEMPRDLVLSTG